MKRARTDGQLSKDEHEEAEAAEAAYTVSTPGFPFAGYLCERYTFWVMTMLTPQSLHSHEHSKGRGPFSGQTGPHWSLAGM